MTYSRWDVAFLFAITGFVGIIGYTAGLSTAKHSPATCSGECCPCDAVDAHVVAKWLDEHKGDVSIIAARSCDAEHHSYAGPAFELVEVNTKAYRGHLILVGVDHHTDTGEAPVGELEGDE